MMEDIKLQYKKLADRIDELSLRERGVIFVSILAVLYLLAANLVFAPLRTEQNRLENQLKAKRGQVQLLEDQMQAILTGGVQGGDAAQRARLAALQEQSLAHDTALARAVSGLVMPKEMARLVEQILLKNRNLQVVRIENLPPAPLTEGARGGEGASARGDAPVYKHGMRIELRGTYLDFLAYLKALEGLQWKVFWGQVSLQTEKYPASRLVLVIYTLSTHEGWIAI